MKVRRTTPILIIVFAQVLRSEESEPLPLSAVGVQSGGNDDSTTQIPLLTIGDEDLIERLDYDDFDVAKRTRTNRDGFDNGNSDEDEEMERYRQQLLVSFLDSWNRETAKGSNVDKQLKQQSKKKFVRIFGIAGFALFVLTCLITFICGLLACCGKLDRLCLRRREANSEEEPEFVHNNSEGLLETDYFPEFDSPPAYSDLYRDSYKHECAQLNPDLQSEATESCVDPDPPPPPYKEVS